jgi:hypothetical protein
MRKGDLRLYLLDGTGPGSSLGNWAVSGILMLVGGIFFLVDGNVALGVVLLLVAPLCVYKVRQRWRERRA